MPATLTFAPHEVEVKVCDYTLSGVVEVSVSFPDKPFKVVKGIRGRNTRVFNKSKHCIINLTLLQTSVSNYILSDLHTNDIVRNNVMLKVQVKDLGGGTQLLSEQAFIASFPDFNFNDGLNNRTWAIECTSYITAAVEGNQKYSADVFSDISGAIGGAVDKVKGFIGL